MAYDGTRGTVVLFGGVGEMRSGSWQNVGCPGHERRDVGLGRCELDAPVNAPGGRSEHSMAYDAGRGRVVLFGGLANDTWELVASPPCAGPGTDDVACDDGNPDTTGDVCRAGVCGGVDLCAGVVCVASDACHVAGTCDRATGLCSESLAPDDTACADDGVSCTTDSAPRAPARTRRMTPACRRRLGRLPTKSSSAIARERGSPTRAPLRRRPPPATPNPRRRVQR